METWSAIVAGLLVALIGNGAALFLWRSQKRKLEADAADILTGAAGRMVKRWEQRVLDLERELKELKKRVRVLEEENECLREGAGKLEGQVESLGGVPVWRLGDVVLNTEP